MRQRSDRTALFVVLLMLLLGLLLFASVVAAQGQQKIYLPQLATPGAAQNPLREGRATFYDASGRGNCSFPASPENLMVAAISWHDYGNPDPAGNPAEGPGAVYCGAYVEAYGPKGSVVVRIVDKCPDAGCLAGHLDLSREAFARIADPALGIVPITWRVVSPPVEGPIAYHFKDGSNQWWTAVQVRNHRNPLAKLEYRNSAGQWVAVTRLDYNYFVDPRGMGPGPYTFRVTDIYGNVLTDSGIAGGDNVTRAGGGQFPVGP